MSKQKTTRELKVQEDLTKLNESIGWFNVPESYNCATVILPKDWYYITSTGKTKNDNWVHTVKSRTTKE
ncbi:MAG: hypothetical protein HRT87_12675, partial [Legionellales bacterium]|nr:hypothetical protein [Legionellales bacterium]